MFQKHKLLTLCLCLSTFLSAQTTERSKRTMLFQAENRNYILQPGEQLNMKISSSSGQTPTRRYLRIKGGTIIPRPHSGRGESAFRSWEYQIDDYLDNENRKNDRYSLLLSGNNDYYEREAYFRIPGNRFTPGKMEVSLTAKGEQISIGSNGHLGVRLEIYYPKGGRHPNDIYDSPDSTIRINVPNGSYDFQTLTQEIELHRPVAAILVVTGGTGFSGKCWMEAPRLIQNGGIVQEIPFQKFAERNDPENYWVGINLTSRNWPLWEITLNGQMVIRKKIFDRSSNVADFYVEIPREIPASGTLSMRLINETTPVSFPYEVLSVELLEESAGPFEIISSPSYVAKGSLFGLLIETNQPDITLSVQTPSSIRSTARQITLPSPGLHTLSFKATETALAPEIRLSDGTSEKTVHIGQIIERSPDDVYLSVGDFIYIDPEKQPDLDLYFKWYIGERMGNFMQFRPSYQWSGMRKADTGTTRQMVQWLEGLNMPFAWQVEGRALAGNKLNASSEVLKSPMFKGKQAHENDGGYYYWNHFLYEGLYSDIAARNRPSGGIFAKHRPIYTSKGTWIHYDPFACNTMADGAQMLVENFSYSKGESNRHTGPSTLFRYLYQAGYEWLGAEQMYGPEETILSSLRGASRAYGKQEYGSLHAMQWGSFPFTDPRHSLRFYLSLATAYMHGSSQINTEDALWIDEYGHDRFGEAGRAHIGAQHKMLDFIETHQRKGRLHTDIAVIQGRNDGWKSFVRGNLWSQRGEKWRFDKANESFDLLKIFYPGNNIDASGPNGWFTSTPYGAIDLLPIEAPQDILNQYKTVIFLGWNSYAPEDFSRLKRFVEQGGTLILSAAHINEEPMPNKPTRYPTNDQIVKELLGNNYRLLTGKCVRPLKKGKIIYFPQQAYPAEEMLRDDYVSAIREQAAAVIAGQEVRGWISSPEKISFTVWDTPEIRTLYLLNIDWQSDFPERNAVFTLEDKRFAVSARLGYIETISSAHGIGVMPQANTTAVLDISAKGDKRNIRIQTTGDDTIRIFDGNTGKSEIHPVTGAGIHTLTL